MPRASVYAGLGAAVLAAGLVHCSTADPHPSGGPAEEPRLGLTAEVLGALADLSPRELPTPPVDVTNRYGDSAAAARLGQRLFFEKRLSGRLVDGDNDGSKNTLGAKGDVGRVSCAGCHIPDAGFSDNRSFERSISLAAGWGRRRSPSLLDVAQSRVLMWDGSRDSLYAQVFGPIESPVEYNSSRLFAAQQIFRLYKEEYEAVFGVALPPLGDAQRFPALDAAQVGCPDLQSQPKCSQPRRGVPGEDPTLGSMSAADVLAVTGVIVNAGKAIAAYERLLSCGPGRFDRWMHGDVAALSETERRGAALFAGELKCTQCHSGPYLSDEKFHNVGVRPTFVQGKVFIDSDDRGAATGLGAALADPVNSRSTWSDGDDHRLPAEVDPKMEGAFRTPKLRCVDARPTFMHTGQFRTLASALSQHAQGGDVAGFPGKNEMSPLAVSEADLAAVEAFLATLRGPGPAPNLLAPLP